MTELKKGTKVRIVLEGILEENSVEHRGEYGALYLDTGIYLEDIPAGAVEALDTPLPTEPGVYVPASYAKNLEYSYVYLLRHGEWMQFDGKTVNHHAHEVAQYAHTNLGGLVPLTVAQ